MEQHPNARLTPRGRETLVSRIESGLGVAETARQMGVSRQTASKWLRRSRSGEPMSDRSSRPRRLAGSTPREIENRVREARSSLPLAPPGLAPGALCLGSGGRLRSSRGLGRGDAGGVDLAQIGELLDEGEAHRVVHLDAAEHDGAVACVYMGCEHGRVETRSDKANAREDNTRGNEPARHGEVDLLRTGHGTHSFLRREMRGSAALLALTLPEGRGGLPRPERREARNLF